MHGSKYHAQFGTALCMKWRDQVLFTVRSLLSFKKPSITQHAEPNKIARRAHLASKSMYLIDAMFDALALFSMTIQHCNVI